MNYGQVRQDVGIRLGPHPSAPFTGKQKGNKRMAAAGVLDITDNNFETDVLQSPTPVLVDFWAPWCGPCKMLSPVIDQLAQEVQGKYRIAKVNTEDAGAIAIRYNIHSIPTLLVFNNGREVNRLTGIHSKNEIKKALETAGNPS
jgi:thioredoxin 1